MVLKVLSVAVVGMHLIWAAALFMVARWGRMDSAVRDVFATTILVLLLSAVSVTLLAVELF